jgi:glycosyltransferase involved in cell wall biosynthesis
MYDLIHVHLLNYHAFAAVLAGKWFKKKTIIKIANSGSRSDIARMQRNELIPGMRQMLPVVLRADCFVALSQLIVDELRDAGVPSERIVEIPNGVEVNTIRPKQDYQLQDPITLIFVGRLHPQKRPDLLLSAFKKAATARPELRWRLLLVGDGPLRSSLETMAQESDIGEIHFCGEVKDVYALLTQADLFVLPSQAEGMSNALLEAMACGLPCIASQISGNSDLIIDGENGRLVDCNETDDLVKIIIDMVDDGQQRKQLGEAARQAIEEYYSMEYVAKRYIKLYKALV